jgi:hypothetical protein
MKTVLLFILSLSLATGLTQAASDQKTKKKTPGKAPQQQTLTIESPKSGSMVSGTIEIVVRGTSVFQQVAASVPGATHVKLEPAVGDPTRWVGKLDTTLIPNGQAQVQVSGNIKSSRASTTLRVDNPNRLFFGDLHSHSMFSDGVLLPETAIDHARNTSKLDFFVLTDHLERGTDATWMDTNEMSYRAHENGRFVVVPGLEWTKSFGHMNIFNPQKRVWPTGLEDFFKEAAAYNVILQVNHASSDKWNFNGLPYNATGDKVVRLFEVRSDKEDEVFRRALASGWHVAPTGTDDSHTDQWGVRAWTGVLMPGLSKSNLLEALRQRHVYSTTDRNCRLRFGVNSAMMGEIIEEPQDTVRISVQVEDPDDQDTIARVEILGDGEVIKTYQPNATRLDQTFATDAAPGKHYYYVRIVQTDGQKLWSAPIWISKR